MFTNTLEQTNKLIDTMWGNWESGLQKVYDAQQEFGKASLETMKKQQEMFGTLTANLNQAEEEIKNSLSKITQSLKENSKYAGNEEAARLLENWNEKMAEIINRTQVLSATPSKALLTLVEQSQERIYESVKTASDEQNKWQTQSRENIGNFLSQVKESQKKAAEMMEAQTKQALETLQPK